MTPSPSRSSMAACCATRGARCSADPPPSTAWSRSAGRPRTTTAGPRWACPAGAGATCCRRSSRSRTTCSVRPGAMASTARGASIARACTGPCSIGSAPLPSIAASPRSRTSTRRAASTKASDRSTSTSTVGGAGARPTPTWSPFVADPSCACSAARWPSRSPSTIATTPCARPACGGSTPLAAPARPGPVASCWPPAPCRRRRSCCGRASGPRPTSAPRASPCGTPCRAWASTCTTTPRSPCATASQGMHAHSTRR